MIDRPLMVQSDRTMLLVFKVCGQIGVITISLAAGSTIGPPADILYPVDPVGVEIITPSPSYSFRNCPLT